MRGRTFRIAAVIAVCSLTLAACGGRDAKPVAVTNPFDSSLDCAAIEREFAANERQIIAVGQEQQNAQAKNGILVATGVILFFPALFFVDPKSPERVEIDALRNRNTVLTDLAKSKRCRAPVSQLDELYRKLETPPTRTER